MFFMYLGAFQELPSNSFQDRRSFQETRMRFISSEAAASPFVLNLLRILGVAARCDAEMRLEGSREAEDVGEAD